MLTAVIPPDGGILLLFMPFIKTTYSIITHTSQCEAFLREENEKGKLWNQTLTG